LVDQLRPNLLAQLDEDTNELAPMLRARRRGRRSPRRGSEAENDEDQADDSTGELCDGLTAQVSATFCHLLSELRPQAAMHRRGTKRAAKSG